MVTASLRLGLAIVLAVFFCVLAGFNIYSMRMYSKVGGKVAGAAMALRIINAVLLLGALGLVVWALVRK